MATVLLINDTWVYNHSILAICKYQWSRAIKILRIYCYRIGFQLYTPLRQFCDIDYSKFHGIR